MSAALMLSGVVWGGPIGIVRIVRLDNSGEFVINPTMDQISECNDLNLVYACTRDKTIMIELQACEISNRDLATTLQLAHREAVKYLEPQIRLAARANKKEYYKLYMTSTTIDAHQSRTTLLYGDNDKEVVGKAAVEKAGLTLSEVVAPLYCESGILPVIHGSSLFCLGDTQALSRVNLRSIPSPSPSSFDVDDDDYFDTLELRFKYSEIARFRFFVNRKCDLLTDKAFCPVLPLEVDFPYEVLIYADDMVNPTTGCGSSCTGTNYTAFVCGSSLALMDAGIPLKRHVAGVSMGFFSKADPSTKMIKDYPTFLTDIDATTRGHDDDDVEMKKSKMELKIAGTREGVTAVHLDLKTPAPKNGTVGISLDIICECLEPALKVRLLLLDHMERAIDAPRYTTPSSTLVKNGWHWRTLGDSNSNYSLKYEGWYNMDYLGSLQLIAPAAIDDDQVDLLQAKKNQTTELMIMSSTSYKEKILEKVVDHSFIRKGFKVGGIYEGAVFSIKEEDGVFVELDGGFCLGPIGFVAVSELLRNDEKLPTKMGVSIGQRLSSAMCTGYDTRGFLKLSLKTQNGEQVKN